MSLRRAEAAGQLQVVEFTPEPHCWQTYSVAMSARTLKPDAYIRLTVAGVSWQYFLELDRGSESSTVLARKLDAYLDYLAASDPEQVFPAVLFLVDAHDSYHSADTAGRAQQLARVAAEAPEPASELVLVRPKDQPPWLEPD